MARVLLIALGARREPADRDEAFDLGDRPWGEVGPGALGISVRRAIDDGATRAAIAARLRHEAPQVRRAAAVVLRHSLGAPDARAAFETSLATETDDDVAQEVGEALVATAAKSGDPAERRRAVEVLLSRAAEAPLDGLRFRTENDLHDLPLEPAAFRTLVEMTDAAKPVAVRLFAWNVLAGSAKASGDDALRTARSGLVTALGTDADPAVRDAAARLLGGLPADDAVVAALARSLRDDREWNVRHAAARSLGLAGDRPGVREALAAAARDADPRVVEQAAESLAGIEARRR